VEKGEIESGTLVWAEGMTQWRAARETPIAIIVSRTPPPMPIATTPPLLAASNSLTATAESPQKESTAPHLFWFESKLKSWRTQAVVGALFMILFSSAFASVTMMKRTGRNDANFLPILMFASGIVTFAATRKLDVVREFRKTGVNRLLLKASLRSLCAVAIYTLTIGVAGRWGGGDLPTSIGTGFVVSFPCYILTILSTNDAVRECKRNPTPDP
jgi:hypothetical protein